jgi:hypothetical protein
VHGKQSDFDLRYRARNSKRASVNVTNWLRQMFLPVGYPSSVHRCYSKVHLCQFVETIATSIVSVMTSQALLTSVGTSSSVESTSAAVAIEWVLTDGMGELGKLFIIQQYAHLFDSHPKSSKLFGELCSILGAAAQISTVFLPNWFIILASIGYCLRGIYISIWIASHTIFNNHLALKDNNMGDLYAKDDSQISLGHIIGLLIGIGILSFSHDKLILLLVFGIVSTIQILMTILLIRSSDYECLNVPRMRLLAHEIVNFERIFSCKSLKGRENWLGEHLLIPGLPNIKLGNSVQDSLQDEWLSERIAILKVILPYNVE